ncbi:hypothetical protein BGZ63DRAFT_369787 [Mariannaea sp. PMI_226]|nr:hypothetical protein BGZ63DRAFT_369787 [Mariannaea sp. PMI_226]
MVGPLVRGPKEGRRRYQNDQTPARTRPSSVVLYSRNSRNWEEKLVDGGLRPPPTSPPPLRKSPAGHLQPNHLGVEGLFLFGVLLHGRLERNYGWSALSQHATGSTCRRPSKKSEWMFVRRGKQGEGEGIPANPRRKKQLGTKSPGQIELESSRLFRLAR